MTDCIETHATIDDLLDCPPCDAFLGDTCNHVTIKSPYCPCSMCNICGWELTICNEHSN